MATEHAPIGATLDSSILEFGDYSTAQQWTRATDDAGPDRRCTLEVGYIIKGGEDTMAYRWARMMIERLEGMHRTRVIR